MQTNMIKDAYISVELKATELTGLRENLLETLGGQGFVCEKASPKVHVSIAYTKGECGIADVEAVAREIARDQFEVRALGFEVLEGGTTPYDYLVLSVEADGAFKNAVEVVETHLKTRCFESGFKGHVSLLRFKKGSLDRTKIENLVRELNASQGAAQALGSCICMEGERVCVFNLQRQRCLEIRIGVVLPMVA